MTSGGSAGLRPQVLMFVWQEARGLDFEGLMFGWQKAKGLDF